MSASMVWKLSEFMHGCFEDFLVAECLVGDIYKNRHTTKKQVQKHKIGTQT